MVVVVVVRNPSSFLACTVQSTSTSFYFILLLRADGEMSEKDVGVCPMGSSSINPPVPTGWIVAASRVARSLAVAMGAKAFGRYIPTVGSLTTA